MTIRSIDVLFRDFETNGVPGSGLHKPIKRDIRDTLKAIAEGGVDASTRIIHLNNIGGTPDDIVVDASETIPPAAYDVLFVINITGTNSGPVTISGAIDRDLTTNTNAPLTAGYLTPGMAVLAVDTGTELRMLSYGDVTAQIQEMLDEATQLSTPADGTVSEAKLTPELAASSPLAVNLFGIGDTYWDSRFDKAIDAAVGKPGGGADIYVPAGNYEITQREIPANVRLIFDGGAVIKARAATPSLFLVTGGLSGIIGGKFVNPDGYATHGLIVDKPADNVPVFIERGYYSQFTSAVQWDDGDCLHLLRNTGVANVNFLNVSNDARNSEIVGNYILGSNGFGFNKVSQGVEGLQIENNIVLPSTGGNFCLNLQCGLEILVRGNVFDQMVTGQAIAIDGQTNAIYGVKILENWMGRQGVLAVNADYGIYGVGNVRSLHTQANTFVGFQEAGISLNGISGGTLLAFTSQDDKFYSADPCVRDIQLTYAEECKIVGARFASPVPIAENAGVSGRVDLCDFRLSGPASTVSSGLKYGHQLAGMTLKNKGSVVVVSAGTAVVVNHGLTYTPTIADIRLIAGTFTPNGTGDLLALSISSTQFTIAPRQAPGVNMDVGWQVDMTR